MDNLLEVINQAFTNNPTITLEFSPKEFCGPIPVSFLLECWEWYENEVDDYYERSYENDEEIEEWQKYFEEFTDCLNKMEKSDRWINQSPMESLLGRAIQRRRYSYYLRGMFV
jgi:hypothetical protein